MEKAPDIFKFSISINISIRIKISTLYADTHRWRGHLTFLNSTSASTSALDFSKSELCMLTHTNGESTRHFQNNWSAIFSSSQNCHFPFYFTHFDLIVNSIWFAVALPGPGSGSASASLNHSLITWTHSVWFWSWQLGLVWAAAASKDGSDPSGPRSGPKAPMDRLSCSCRVFIRNIQWPFHKGKNWRNIYNILNR